MQCIPRTEAASYAVNGKNEHKKRNNYHAAEHLEDSVQLYEDMYRRQQERPRLRASVRRRLSECSAFRAQKRHSTRSMAKEGRKSGNYYRAA